VLVYRYVRTLWVYKKLECEPCNQLGKIQINILDTEFDVSNCLQ
jgi:hypothetical protein